MAHVDFGDFDMALQWCVALLALKAIVLSLLTVRARIGGEPVIAMAPEDENAGERFLLGYIVKPLLLLPPGMQKGAVLTSEVKSVGTEEPMLSQLDAMAEAKLQSIKRMQRLHQNALEQEPFIVAAACTFRLLEKTNVVAAYWLLIAYLSCRFIHTPCYMCKLQPFRTLMWTAGSVCGIGICVLLLV